MVPPRLIVFYGTPGLESQIFQTYMQSSGYQVQIVTGHDGVIRAADANRSAITVIALDKSPSELTELAREIRAHANGSHIFILSGEQGFDPGMPHADVITRPFRLSEVIQRIQVLARKP